MTNEGENPPPPRLNKQETMLRDQLTKQIDSAITHAPRRLRGFGKDVQTLQDNLDAVDIDTVQDAKDELRGFLETAIDATLELERLAPGHRPDARVAL